MVWTLAELTEFEAKNIGQAIIGLDKPDLSMFAPGERDRILSYAIGYIAKNLGNRASALVPRIKALHPMLTFDWMREIHDLKRAVENLPEYSGEQDELFAYFGMRDNLLKKADRELRKKWKRHENGGGSFSSYSLEQILHLYELAGKKPSEQEITEMGRVYLLENEGDTRALSVATVLQKKGLKPRIENEDLLAILKACDRQLGRAMAVNRGKEYLDQSRQAIDFLLEPFTATIQGRMETALSASQSGYGYVAARLTRIATESATPEQRTGITEQAKTVADRLWKSGLFAFAAGIYKNIGLEFDTEEAYSILVNGLKAGKGNLHFMPMQYLLLDVEPSKLRKQAEEIRAMTYDKNSPIARGTVQYFAIQFLFAAYLKLGMKQDEIEELLVSKKDDEQETTSPSAPAQSEQRQMPARKGQVNLETVLMKMPGFKRDVRKAYGQRGIDGVAGVISEYASRLKEGEFTHLFAAPEDVLRQVLSESSKGLTRATEVSLLERAIDVGHEWGDVSHDLEKVGRYSKTDPVSLAFGIISAMFGRYDNPSAVHGVEYAETLIKKLKIKGARVPQLLYRLAGAEALGNALEFPRSYKDPYGIDKRRVYEALLFYSKVREPGLRAFADVNFGPILGKENPLQAVKSPK